MSMNTTDVQVGDLLIPTGGSPAVLVEHYAGTPGKVVEKNPYGVRLKFAEPNPHWEAHRVVEGDTYWFTEWITPPLQRGSKVRVIAALPGATEEFKRMAAGQTATVVVVSRPGDGRPVVRFDAPFRLDAHTWAESAVSSVVPIDGPRPARVGDRVIPTQMTPQSLQNFYAGKVGTVVEAGVDRPGYFGVRVDFEESTSGGHVWWVSEWRFADEPTPGEVLGEALVATAQAQVNEVAEPVTAESLRQEIRDLNARHERLQDVLAEQAEERDWCSEFEEFCENNDLESRRQGEHEYEITVDVEYDKSVDEMVDYIEGTSCATDSDRVRFTYRTTVSWRGTHVDDADVSDLLYDAGFSEYSDYTVVDTSRID